MLQQQGLKKTKTKCQHCLAFPRPGMLHYLKAQQSSETHPGNLSDWRLSKSRRAVAAAVTFICWSLTLCAMKVLSLPHLSLLDWSQKVTGFQYEIKGRHVIEKTFSHLYSISLELVLFWKWYWCSRCINPKHTQRHIHTLCCVYMVYSVSK